MSEPNIVPIFDNYGNIIGYEEYQDPWQQPDGTYAAPPGTSMPANTQVDPTTGQLLTFNVNTRTPTKQTGPDAVFRPPTQGTPYGDDTRADPIPDDQPPPTQNTPATNWFDDITARLSTYGAAPAPYGEDYTALARPDYLKDPYVAPTWNETFTAPTLQDLYNEPGYQARMDASQKASERRAAAQGRVLSGGYGVALGREMQNQASNEYGNVFNRAADTYQQRYGEFSNAANMGLQARGINEGAYATDAMNHLNQYTARYKAYQDQIANTRNAETDRWTREMGLARLGLDATLGGRPA